MPNTRLIGSLTGKPALQVVQRDSSCCDRIHDHDTWVKDLHRIRLSAITTNQVNPAKRATSKIVQNGIGQSPKLRSKETPL